MGRALKLFFLLLAAGELLYWGGRISSSGVVLWAGGALILASLFYGAALMSLPLLSARIGPRRSEDDRPPASDDHPVFSVRPDRSR